MLDQDHQYFLAEATKSLNLADVSQSEDGNDELFFDCASSYAAGRLYARTIGLSDEARQATCYTIEDLQEIHRYSDLALVTSSPHFRFYAGVPTTTKRQLHIGTLFVLDTKPQPLLTRNQEQFLRTVSHLIMNHLEIRTEAESRKKLMRMSAGLNAFVEGKSRVNHHRSATKRRTSHSRSNEQRSDKAISVREMNMSSTSGFDIPKPEKVVSFPIACGVCAQ